jgi:hypothetical protein
MKKITMITMAAAVILMSSCGMGAQGNTANSSNAAQGSVLGAILSGATDGQTVGNVLQSVLGLDKVTKANLIGTWKYSQPGCAFTSQNLLAQAGGEAVATTIKQKMSGYYSTAGIKSSNTQVTFNENGTFTAKIAGKSWQGNWTFDEANYKITMQGILINVNCYAKKNSNGIGLLFEGKKLLTLLQTMTALSGNQTAQTIGDLSKNYDGVRVGFDMTK